MQAKKRAAATIDHSRWLVCLSGGIMEPNRTILAPHCERVADDSCDLKLCLTSVRHPATCHQSPGGVKYHSCRFCILRPYLCFSTPTRLEQLDSSLPSFCIARFLEDADSRAVVTVALSAIEVISLGKHRPSSIQNPSMFGLELLFLTEHLPRCRLDDSHTSPLLEHNIID